jgi:hypothetical protein
MATDITLPSTRPRLAPALSLPTRTYTTTWQMRLHCTGRKRMARSTTRAPSTTFAAGTCGTRPAWWVELVRTIKATDTRLLAYYPAAITTTEHVLYRKTIALHGDVREVRHYQRAAQALDLPTLEISTSPKRETTGCAS